MLDGQVPVQLLLEPRFEYGAFTPRFTLTSDHTAEIVGRGRCALGFSDPPAFGHRDGIEASWQLSSGEEVWVEVAWSPSHAPLRDSQLADADVFSRRLQDTIAFWKDWMGQCWYHGDHEERVRRSALVLKALTYSPTGAVVAAPTTSLPEEIGGGRNWTTATPGFVTPP